MLLVRDSELTLNDTTKDTADNIQFFKIQFIASCKIESFEKDMLVAFYVDNEYIDLCAYVLGPLPERYTQTHPMNVIDYKSYSEICELTGETKLSLADYYFQLKASQTGANSLLRWKGTVYTNDTQTEFLNKYDAEIEKALSN